MNRPQARKCAYCGKPRGCFAYTLQRNGKAESGYYHLRCLVIAKAEADNAQVLRKVGKE